MVAERVVLIVDDDHAVLETMQMLLEGKGGFRVYAAKGQAGGLACLSAQKPIDVLVADVILAGATTGIEICQMARRLHPQIALVIISADPKVDTASFPERSIYLRKPFGGDDLIRAMAQAQWV